MSILDWLVLREAPHPFAMSPGARDQQAKRSPGLLDEIKAETLNL